MVKLYFITGRFSLLNIFYVNDKTNVVKKITLENKREVTITKYNKKTFDTFDFIEKSSINEYEMVFNNEIKKNIKILIDNYFKLIDKTKKYCGVSLWRASEVCLIPPSHKTALVYYKQILKELKKININICLKILNKMIIMSNLKIYKRGNLHEFL